MPWPCAGGWSAWAVPAARRTRSTSTWLRSSACSFIGVTFRTRTVEEDIACSRRFAEDLLGALDDGRLRPVLHGSFPWEEIEAAYASMAEDNHIGKIVAIL